MLLIYCSCERVTAQSYAPSNLYLVKFLKINLFSINSRSCESSFSFSVELSLNHVIFLTRLLLINELNSHLIIADVLSINSVEFSVLISNFT